MATNVAGRSMQGDRAWHIVGRWQEYEGEARANLLRIVGIAAFYAIELANYHGLNLGFLQLPRQADITPEFHRAVTALTVAWTMVALAVHLCLVRQVFPAVLKYISTAADLLLLTAILTVADGPRSPLVVGYFLIIALSGLRFSLALVRFTTVGALAAYLVLCGYARWYAARDVRVPRYHQIMMLLALALTGIVLGQILRRVQSVAKEYANRAQAGRG
jgi:hypothetical protein